MDPIDYTKLSVPELEDVAAHIDRRKYSERAVIVDAELKKRRISRTAETFLTPKAPGRGWFVAGGVFFAIAVVPFAVAALLHALSFVDIGNALGFGLLLYFAGFLGVVCVLLGLAVSGFNRMKR